MSLPDKEVLERKLGFVNRYRNDLAAYAALDSAGRRREHYAVERLLQLLCESSADIALQFLKAAGDSLPASYREIFTRLERVGALPADLAAKLVAACGMRNVLTHLYDEIDMDRVVAAVEPAIDLYGAFARWAVARIGWLKRRHLAAQRKGQAVAPPHHRDVVRLFESRATRAAVRGREITSLLHRWLIHNG